MPQITGMSPLLLVYDLERSIDFYVRVLQFNINFRHDDFYAGIVKEGYTIHLKSGTPLASERNLKRQNEDVDILFSVDAVEDLYNELVTKSVEITQPLRIMSYGKEFYIADPDGYLLAFLGKS